MKKANLLTKDIEKIDVTKDDNKIDTETTIKGEDITKYVLPRLSKKYVASIKKVIKDGRSYIIIYILLTRFPYFIPFKIYIIITQK